MVDLMIPLLLAAIIVIFLVWGFGPQWLFLCRSSLLGLALMYFLPLVGTTVAKGLCIGAFDLKGFSDAFTVGFPFFFACWAVTATSDLVLDLAAKRLDQALPPVKESLHTVRSASIVFAFGLNYYAILVATEAGLSKRMLRITLGLLAGLVAGFVLFVVLQYFDAKRANEKFQFTRIFRRLLKKRESESPNIPPLSRESNNPISDYRGLEFQYLGAWGEATSKNVVVL
jgi:hypothetical protein